MADVDQALGGGAPIICCADPQQGRRFLTMPVPTDAAVAVLTSGSTGAPRAVVLSRDAIVAAAEAFRERYGSFTWTLALPQFYVAGVMVLARGLLDRAHGGWGVNRAASDLSDARAEHGPAALSIVPTQLVRALADEQVTNRLRDYAAILVGGARLDPELVVRARDAGLAILTSYGMSETCGGCVFDGLPLPGVEVTLDNNQRVHLGGPMLFSGYLGDEQASVRALSDGRLRTNDRGRLVGGRLEVLGRFDDLVISGGVNVDLARLQAVINQTAPGEHLVVGVPDQEWGTRIVLATTGDHPLAWWRSRLADHVGVPALPKQILRFVEMPRLASGKIDRQGIIDQARKVGW